MDRSLACRPRRSLAGRNTTCVGPASSGRRRVIDVTCMFGGVGSCAYRRDWTVHNDIVALFGGVDDKREDAGAEGPATVSIRGTVLFGGLTIKD